MRTPPRPVYQQLDEARDDLDRLMADLALGMRSQARFDNFEAQADAIGKKLRAAFRSRAEDWWKDRDA